MRALKLPVSVSHELIPEFHEYERLSTTVINAYLAPRLGSYLRRLERAHAIRLNKSFSGASGANQRSGGAVFVMQSNGGITSASRAAREPVRTILSGPAGGVTAAGWLAGILNLPRVISFDMGGTSTDVCLLKGAARTTSETVVAGLPVAVPVLNVHSVGAGGGSIARLDAGGALRVGPESAGAAPGPICYGRGGTHPTVTDARTCYSDTWIPIAFWEGSFGSMPRRRGTPSRIFCISRAGRGSRASLACGRSRIWLEESFRSATPPWRRRCA